MVAVRHCERSEAIHASERAVTVDCFASLAMTWIRRRVGHPHKKENARGERAFSIVNLGVVGGLKYPRSDFGGL
ncbi:hypothetical protein ACVMIH_003727 [Bradyrhizobium sp. USDA 4503]|nr:hypothetical protein [Bradyrhizobium sp. USDA 4545]MCP1849601.1 hypothetical protein [Bradyrhizobium sp. USDA 4541]MCP1924015.1 hypothetical protein [Bradyrhizobium sp. USDA 4532]